MPDLSAYATLYWILGVPITIMVYRLGRHQLVRGGVNDAFNILGIIGVFLSWPLHVILWLIAGYRMGYKNMWAMITQE